MQSIEAKDSVAGAGLWPADVERVLTSDGRAAGAAPVSDDVAVAMLKLMVLVRSLDERMITLQREGRIAYHTSGLGDEALVVAAAMASREKDWLFPEARHAGAAVVRGLPVGAYVHQAFGNARDALKGHASPDHIAAPAVRVGSVSGIRGNHLGHAVGAAWAAKIRKHDAAAVAILGAGGLDAPDFHNALNFAGVAKVPVVFLCARRSADVDDRAVAYGIRGHGCDGTDVFAVYKLLSEALERARRGEGATLVDAWTQAWEPTPAWSAHDPIVRLRRYLESRGAWSESAHDACARDVGAEIDRAVQEAEKAGAPPSETLFADVFGTMPAHLRAQLAGTKLHAPLRDKTRTGE